MDTENKTSKLFQLLSRIKKKELERLNWFFQSPYFNRSAVFVTLLDALLSYHPNFVNTNKEIIFAAAFPEQRFSKQEMNERFSQMSRLVEQFLLQEEIRQQPVLNRELQLSTFRNRGIPQWFLKTFTQQIHELSSRHPAHWRDTHHLWSAYHSLHIYPEAAFHQDLKEKTDMPLHYLDEYYFLHKLRYACDAMASSQFFEGSRKILLLDEIVEKAGSCFSEHPIIQLYVQLFQLFKSWDYDRFKNAETLFYCHYPKLEVSDQYFVLLTLVNLASNQSQDERLIADAFAIFKRGIQDDLFLEKCKLSDGTFLNICTYGAYQQEVSWTLSFIKKHQHLLPEKIRSSAVALGKALVRFHSGQFGKAADLLNEVRPNHYRYKLRIRSLHVRCMLELHLKDTTNYLTLRSAVAAFNQFLSRNRALRLEVKQSYRNLNKAVMRIAELRQYGWERPFERKKLAHQLNELSPLIARSWLLTKLNEE